MLNIYLYLQQIFSSKSQIRKNLLNEILEVSLRHYLNYYSTFLFNDDERMDFLFDNNHLIFGLSNKNKLFKEYSILSTGERKKIEIILILSLNSLINNINRPKLNLFIFDEFFDGLDEESVNGLMDLLNSY
jgi:DNA repair exonuclease SbcCD ATPase subunit